MFFPNDILQWIIMGIQEDKISWLRDRFSAGLFRILSSAIQLGMFKFALVGPKYSLHLTCVGTQMSNPTHGQMLEQELTFKKTCHPHKAPKVKEVFQASLPHCLDMEKAVCPFPWRWRFGWSHRKEQTDTLQLFPLAKIVCEGSLKPFLPPSSIWSTAG